LADLGQREGGTARLEQAVHAYRLVLKEWTRDRVPLDWAQAQHNLGLSLATLGQRESGTARLEQAIQAYERALDERTRTRLPLEWAGTRANQGVARLVLAERTGSLAEAEAAALAFRDAWSVYGEALPQHDGWFEARIADAEDLAAQLAEAPR
jgi:tetratricopeptide (TPR) repeat protein